MLLSSAAALLLAGGVAGAQQLSGTTSAAGGTNAGAVSRSAPTSLLPQGGVANVTTNGTLNQQNGTLNQQNGTLSQQNSAANAAVLSGQTQFNTTTGQTSVVPVPMNTPGFATAPIAVPPPSGTAVPPLGGDTGLGTPTQIQSPAAQQAFNQQLQLQQLQQAQQLQLQTGQQFTAQQLQPQPSLQTGGQILVLSGSVFQGTTSQPNVIATNANLNARNRIRGLSTRNLSRGQSVLQVTTQAPQVIAFTPAPGNVLVLQGSGLSATGVNSGGGQVPAQIVEVPAPQ
jgi:hypothetical protein